MKIIIIGLLLFLFHQSFAQQRTFDFFKWNEIQQPLFRTSSSIQGVNGIPEPSADKASFFWSASKSSEPGKIILSNGRRNISVESSKKEKAGLTYNYECTTDENDTKIIKANGFSSAGQFTYDFYCILHDTNGITRYVYPSNLGVADTVGYWWWYGIQQIGKNLLISTDKKFIWSANPVQQISLAQLGIATNTYQQCIFSDYKNTLYAVRLNNYQQYSIVTFHADGTFARRLPGATIKGVSFNKSKGILTAYTDNEVFELIGKNDVLLPSSEYRKISKSTAMVPFAVENDGIEISGVITTKGFIVNDGTRAATYVFAEKPEAGSDSLEIQEYYPVKNLNLQSDSSIVFAFKKSGQEKLLYLFQFKHGQAKLARKYNLTKLGLTEAFNLAYYIGKDDSYLYSFPTYGPSIFQIKNDSIKTAIPVAGTECYFYCKSSDMRADKDYLWIKNEATDITTNPCSVVRMSHENYIVKGNVYYDANSNGLREASEFGYSKIKLILYPSQLHVIPDQDGAFSFKGKAEEKYQIKVHDSLRFFSIKINQNQLVAGVKLHDEKPEVKTSFFIPGTRCNTMFNTSFTISNTGVAAAERITIQIVSEKLHLLQNNQKADTISFEIKGLKVARDTVISYTIIAPEAELVGQMAKLKFATKIWSGAQLAFATTDSLISVVRCSYDPNDKAVNPLGEGFSHYTLKKSRLNYLIRFENTGNDTAYTVTVHDTLSKNLDWSTLEVTGTSHKVSTTLDNSGIVQFTFLKIMLPDSTTNKQRAQGFVKFSISPKKGLADNAVIMNRAGIVFDENKPILTNTVFNTLVDQLPVITMTTDPQTTNDLLLYPNPGNGQVNIRSTILRFEVWNTFGCKLLEGSDNTIDVSELTPSVYLVKVFDKEGCMRMERLSVLK